MFSFTEDDTNKYIYLYLEHNKGDIIEMIVVSSINGYPNAKYND